MNPLLSVAAHVAAGLALGVLYFHGLWRSARRFASGGRAAATVALAIGRFVLLGGALGAVSLEGAPPLLGTTLGLLIGRAWVMRQVRTAAP